jgi:hypothetical protein
VLLVSAASAEDDLGKCNCYDKEGKGKSQMLVVPHDIGKFNCNDKSNRERPRNCVGED